MDPGFEARLIAGVTVRGVGGVPDVKCSSFPRKRNPSKTAAKVTDAPDHIYNVNNLPFSADKRIERP